MPHLVHSLEHNESRKAGIAPGNCLAVIFPVPIPFCNPGVSYFSLFARVGSSKNPFSGRYGGSNRSWILVGVLPEETRDCMCSKAARGSEVHRTTYAGCGMLSSLPVGERNWYGRRVGVESTARHTGDVRIRDAHRWDRLHLFFVGREDVMSKTDVNRTELWH